MKTSQKLELRASKIRERLNEISAIEGELSDEIRTEAASLETEYRDVEAKKRAAVIAEDEAAKSAETRAAGTAQDPEQREREALRRRVSIGRYLAAGAEGRPLSGAEEEYRQAVGAAHRTIPLDAFEGRPGSGPGSPETRADAATAAPSTIGVNMTGLVPAAFAQSCAAFLGIRMPRVESGQYSTPRLTTDLTAGMKAKGAAQESTAAAFTVVSRKPKRLSARLSLRAEDLAEVGIPGFEASLRENLMRVLADTLDIQLLRGNGTAPNLNGLHTQLTADTAAGTTITFPTFLSDLAGYIDGKFAAGLRDLRVIANAAIVAKLASLTPSNDDSVTAALWAGQHTGGLRGNSNMKASASNVGNAIVVRAATMAQGVEGAMAEAPVWGDLSIADPYSDAASAMSHYTVHMLIGDPVLRYPDAYRDWSIKTA